MRLGGMFCECISWKGFATIILSLFGRLNYMYRINVVTYCEMSIRFEGIPFFGWMDMDQMMTEQSEKIFSDADNTFLSHPFLILTPSKLNQFVRRTYPYFYSYVGYHKYTGPVLFCLIHTISSRLLAQYLRYGFAGYFSKPASMIAFPHFSAIGESSMTNSCPLAADWK